MRQIAVALVVLSALALAFSLTSPLFSDPASPPTWDSAPPPLRVELVAEDGVAFTPGCRCGTVPWDLTTELRLNGRRPFTITYFWGDGDEDTFITNQFQHSALHRYDTVGNFTLTLRLEDDVDAVRTLTWPISSYTGGYLGTYAFNLMIEGYDTAGTPNLPIPQNLPRGITAIMENTGDRTLDQFEFGWADADCSPIPASPLSFGLGIGLAPGILTWFTVTTTSADAVGTIDTESIQVARPSLASPSIEECQELTTEVVSGLDATRPIVSIALSPGIQRTPVGTAALFNLNMNNTGLFAERIDTALLGQEPSVSVIPSNPGTWGTINGTFRHGVVNQRLYLLPGEEVNIPVSIQGTIPLSDDLIFQATPQRLSLDTGNRGTVASTSAAFEITAAAGAIIATLSAFIPLDDRADLSGKVISLAGNAFIDVFFQIREVGDVAFLVFPSAAIRVSEAGTVITRTVALTPDTLFEFEFVGQAASGDLVYGGLVEFTTTVSAEVPFTDFTGVLAALEGLSGFDRTVWGYLIGGAILGMALFLMNWTAVPLSKPPDWRIQLIIILAILVLNVFLWLWHPGILILLGIFSAVLIIQEMRARAGSSSGGGA